MESNKYNIENFERFLREKTDEFRMYPSKRVWYSIYNNMHPGNRLPSVSMSIILIGFLFLVGYLNTSDISKTAVAVKNETKETASQLAAVSNPGQDKTIQSATDLQPDQYAALPSSAFNNARNEHPVAARRQTGSYTSQRNTAYPVTVQAANVNIAVSNGQVEEMIENHSAVLINDITKAGTGNLNTDNSIAGNTNNFNDKEATILKIQEPASPLVSVDNNAPENPVAFSSNKNVINTDAVKTGNVKTNNAVAEKSNTNATGLSHTDKAWIEDFALHNKPAAKKWAGKLSLQAYITPSIVYRKLRNNAADKILNGTSNGNFNNYDAEDAVTHKPSFGLETGLSLQYDLSKKIKVKAGMQLNYTRYNALAFETNHPIATSITMNADDNILTYEVFRTSNYSNIFGLSSTKLHNETYQLSLPVGADFKLGSIADNFAWYAGATIQPTVVLYGRSYIISTDRRSYVQDPSLLNRFNLNAGFETYLSYKTCGYTLQMGPQYRTQLFTTNTKMYSVEERLQNFGFKIGVTKRL